MLHRERKAAFLKYFIDANISMLCSIKLETMQTAVAYQQVDKVTGRSLLYYTDTQNASAEPWSLVLKCFHTRTGWKL